MTEARGRLAHVITGNNRHIQLNDLHEDLRCSQRLSPVGCRWWTQESSGRSLLQRPVKHQLVGAGRC